MICYFCTRMGEILTMNTLPKVSKKRSSHSLLPIDIEKFKKEKSKKHH